MDPEDVDCLAESVFFDLALDPAPFDAVLSEGESDFDSDFESDFASAPTFFDLSPDLDSFESLT